MVTVTSQTRHYWIFSADPHHYHWDTLFVKGKEMWQGAESKADAIRALKQVRRGDRVLCYHSTPERSLYSIAEITARSLIPTRTIPRGKPGADLRAYEKLPRPVTLAEMRANHAVRKMKLLKNVRLLISAISDEEYQELLRMAGIVAMPGSAAAVKRRSGEAQRKVTCSTKTEKHSEPECVSTQRIRCTEF